MACGRAEARSDRERTTWLDSVPEVAFPAESAATLGGPDAPFRRVASAQMAGDSVVVVFDGSRFSITALRLDGGPPAHWGRWGQGPAEFRSLEGAVGVDGQIWVWDAAQLRVSRFDTRGRLLDDFPLWSFHPVGRVILGASGDHCLWVLRAVVDTASIERGDYGRGSTTARCLGPEEASPSVSFVDTEYVVRREGRGVHAVPFGRRTMLAASGGHLWATPNDSLDLERIDREANRATLTALPALRRALPTDVVERLESTVRAQVRRHRPGGLPDAYPDIEAWWGDPRGGGWIHIGDTLVRLNETGEAVVRMIPPAGTLLHIDGQHALTLRYDARWGSPLIDVWRLGPPE